MTDRTHHLDLRDGKFHGTTPQDLVDLFAALEASPMKNHLVVHFHGGLVSRSSAEQAATGLMPYYEAGGAYPVFFFWRSDLGSVLTGNLAQVAQEPVFQRLLKRLVQLALGRLVGTAGARAGGTLQLAPEDDLPDDLVALADYAADRTPDPAETRGTTLSDAQADQAEVELETDAVIQAESRAIAAGLGLTGGTGARGGGGAAGVQPRGTRLSREVLDELRGELPAPGPGARFGTVTLATLVLRGVKVLRRVIGRFGQQRDHGLFTTIVEELLRELYLDEIGTGVWNLIKQDTLDAFGGDPQRHGGTAFLERLAAWWRPGRAFTLVGHSTGAISIGHFLAHADAVLPAEARGDCVFLAPACTFAFLADKLPVFQKRVRRLRQFALRDSVESAYWEAPPLYRGSLLYMVSGLFELPESDQAIVGMQRYFSGTAPYTAPELTAVAAYLAGRTVWAPSNGPAGWRSAAATHGGFDNDLSTRESLRDFLAGY